MNNYATTLKIYFLSRESSLNSGWCTAQDSLTPQPTLHHFIHISTEHLKPQGDWGWGGDANENKRSQVLNLDPLQRSEVNTWEKVSIPIFKIRGNATFAQHILKA